MIFAVLLPFLRASIVNMKSVPIPTQSFEPPKVVITQFAAISQESLLNAKMKLTTSKPTIRLSNHLDVINSISCSDSILNIGFNDVNNLSEAYKLWSNQTDLAFIIDERYNCNDDEIATVITSRLSINTTTLRIQASYDLVGIEQIVDDWSAEITEDPLPSIHALLKQTTINLNFNLSRLFMKMRQPGFTIYDHDMIHFQNCYTTGSVSFTLELHGHRKRLLSYRMSMEGEFNANAEVKLGILPNQEMTLFRTSLLTIPLSPWSIPGILTIGPSFGIEIGLYGFSDSKFSVEYGFDYHLPIHFEIASDDLKTTPSHKTGGNAKFNAHPPKYTFGSPAPTMIGGFVNLAPNIAFGVTVMGTDLVEISGSFNNEFGLIHRFGKGTSCPDMHNSIELFTRQIIGAALTVWPVEWTWSFFDSGRKLMYITCKEDIGRFNETMRMPQDIPK